VLTYPTDLSSEEQELARARLDDLADKLTADGVLRTARWREVFLRTWWHPYVPSFSPELGAPCLLCIDPQRRNHSATYAQAFAQVTSVSLAPINCSEPISQQ